MDNLPPLHVSRLLAAAPGLVGFTILAAWQFDIEAVQRFGLASVAMNPATALCMVFLSIAILVRGEKPVWASRVSMVLLLAVAGAAALKLVETLTGTGPGIDKILYASKLDLLLDHPNRMAPNTAASLLLMSVSVFLARGRSRPAVVAGQVLALATGVIALFALTGYLYGVHQLYKVPAFIPMAAHTAICLLMLTAAILALTSRTGIMEPIAHEGFAGRSARMLMPVVLVGPLTFGWLRIQGEQMGLYPSETGVALTITVIVLTLAIFVWWNARTLLDLDRQRVAAEVALRETNEHLERRVAERTIEIERRRQFLDAVLSGMQDALIVNKSGRIAYANEAGVRLFGADSETGLIGRSPLTLIHPDDHPAVLARIKDLTAQPTQVPTIEERIVRLDGKTVDVEVTAASFFDGAEPAIVAMFRDITERKSMERLLQRSQRLDAIGQLTGGIAHDFNNLLCVVISNLDLLEEDLKNDPAARELSDAALKAALRGAELTRQLLAFSRKQTLAPRAIELNALVDETATLLRRTLGEAIEVRINATEGLWPAIADPTQVESALMNLAINARDAMPEGGSITIETANKHLDETYAAEHTDVTAGDYVMLAVSDTGSGIPHEMLEKVFEPFFTTKADGKGSGLGLSMVYGFAKQSRGHVKIYSEMGHGTTVRLYLPRSTEAATAPESRPASVNDDFNGATILVVEDNPDVRDAVVRQLTQAGYAVLQAENAATALELLCHSRHVDLLFSDVVMGGGMTGIDLAAEAKKCRPDLSILLTSGFAEAALNRSSGGVEFPLLSKPYRKQDLLHRVNELLSARSPRVGRNLSQSGSRQ